MNDVQNVLGDDVVTEPLALLRQVHLTKVAGHFLEEVTRASSSSILESKVLQRDEPDECHKVCDYYVRTHQVKHFGIPLDMVKKSRCQKENESRTRKQVPLQGDIFRIRVLHGPCAAVSRITLVLRCECEVRKEHAEDEQTDVVDWSDLRRDH